MMIKAINYLLTYLLSWFGLPIKTYKIKMACIMKGENEFNSCLNKIASAPRATWNSAALDSTVLGPVAREQFIQDIVIFIVILEYYALQRNK